MSIYYLSATRPGGVSCTLQCRLLAVLLLLPLAGSYAQAPTLTGLSPARNALAAPVGGNLNLTFSQAINPATTGNVRVWGNQRRGLRALSRSGGNPVLLDPAQDFAPGEAVSVTVPATVLGANGVAVVPQLYQFRAAAGTGPGTFGAAATAAASTNPLRVVLADLDNDDDLDVLTSYYNATTYRRNDGTGAWLTGSTSVNIGTALSDVVVADFDNDGDLDVLGCNASSLVSFQRNNGAGTFTTSNANTIDVVNGADHLALGDVDADGDLDLLVTYPGDAGVGVCRNDGSGTFGIPAVVPVANYPTALALGDVDLDGDLDLLVADAGSDVVSVYRNDGSGSFGAATDFAMGTGPALLTLADLNGDGDLDMLTYDYTHQALTIRLGAAGAVFGSSRSLTLPTDIYGLTAGDVDGDGDLDLVLAAQSSSADVLRNNGSATFSFSTSPDGPHNYYDVTLGDVDGDGDLDLMAVDATLSQTLLRRNLPLPVIAGFAPGSGTVGSSVTINGSNFDGTTLVSFNGVSVAAGGFAVNPAGTVITATVPVGTTTGPVRVTTAAGTATSVGNFSVGAAVALVSRNPARNALAAARAANVTLGFSQAVAAGSETTIQVQGNRRARTHTVSGGGTASISFDPATDWVPGETVTVTVPGTVLNAAGVGSIRSSYQFTAAAGAGAGTFGGGNYTWIDHIPTRVVTADLDNDGDLDFVSVAGSAVPVTVGFNNGTGSFAGTARAVGTLGPTALAAGDVDHDGDLDVVVAGGSFGGGGSTHSALLLRNNGSGGFTLGTPFAVGAGVRDVALADFDNDGDLDLATANFTANTVSIRFNDGLGNFRGGSEVPTGPAYALAVADLDDDGAFDLLTVNHETSGLLAWSRNDGLGNFAAVRTTAIAADASSLTVGDVNGDGRLDVLTLHPYTAAYHPRNTAAVLLGTGGGNLAAAGETLLADTPVRAVLGDVDGDGDLDLAVAAQGTSLVSIRRNNGSGSFGAGTDVNVGGAPVDVVLADLDGDLDLDVLSVLPNPDLISVRFNVALPVITGLSPATGPVGTAVTVTGSNLTGTTQLSFNGIPATFTVVNATTLTAVVPVGAATGLVQVTTPGSNPSSPQLFVVLGAGPTLLSATPAGNQPDAPLAGNVQLTFSQAITTSSASNVLVQSNLSRGRRSGTRSGGGTAAFTFDPSQDFAPGEEVTVTVPATVQGAGGAATPQVVRFTAGVGGGVGTFGPGPDVAAGTTPHNVTAADVDNDGDLDLLVSSYNGSTNSSGVSVRLNDGLGNFSGTQFVSTYFNPLKPLTGDLDGDGDLDFVTTHYVNEQAGVLSVRLNSGGLFGGGQTTSLGESMVGGALGDLDGDGDLDVVVTTLDRYGHAGGHLALYLNNGAGALTSAGLPISLGLGSSGGKVEMGDLDGDGDLDLVLGAREQTVLLALNNGHAAFAFQPEFAVVAGGDMLLRDLDGDRDLDLLLGNSLTGGLTTYANDGRSHFGSGQAVRSGFSYEYNTLATGDVDGDGDLDLVQTQLFSDQTTVRVYLNNGLGVFGLRQELPISNNPSESILADLNGDGTLDLAIADQSSNLVKIRFNAVLLLDLVVSTTTNVAGGNYHNVTVTSTGNGTLLGPLSATGTIAVQGGTLNSACQPITGAADFTLAADGTLGICDAAGISQTGATGAVQTTGTRTFSSDASYTYNGSVAQVAGTGLPARVRNLTVDNAGHGLTLTQGVAVAEVLGLLDGSLNTSGRPLTLRSSAAGTALVDNTGGTVQGTATVERWIDPAANPGAGYRHLASPIAAATVGSLATNGFTPALNAAYNGSATPGLVMPFPTVFGYDQSRLATSVATPYSYFDRGWVSPASQTEALAVGRGYTVHLPGNETVRFVGTLNNGPIGQVVPRALVPAAETGYHLLGNPYPSPLDWSLLGIPAGLDNALYVFQSTGAYAGTYRAYVNGIGSSPIVALGQGFFVRANTPGSNAALNFTNAARITTFGLGQNFSRSAADPRPQVQLSLRAPGLPADQAYVYFEAGATAGRDGRYDADKLLNAGATLHLATRAPADGSELAINGLPLLNGQPCVVPLTVAAPQPGSYTLVAEAVANFTTSVYLLDAVLGTRQRLQAGTAYPFTLAASTVPNRFSLEFAPATALATAASSRAAEIGLYPNPATTSFTIVLPVPLAAAQLTLFNSLGQAVLNQVAASLRTEVRTGSLVAGVYSLHIVAPGQAAVVKRVVIK